MQPILYNDIQIKGELAVRALRNYARLEGKWYHPEEVFTADQHGWPGDWEGRLILALSLLTECTHRTAAYLDEIMEKLPEHLNSRGYLGKVLPKGMFDEQQMAGHSWLLRGLLEYYKITGDQKIWRMVLTIIENLLLPARSYYQQYPIDAEKRTEQQDIWILSKLQTKTKNHAESSDAGCAFIMLDGASAVYEVYKKTELKVLIDEMIQRYLQMDFCKLHIQTHATLSACRGILRMYENTGEKKYLEIAEKIFKMYQTEAWTEAFGNYNWFGIPRWTESCAVIDSFILSVGLWKNTGKQSYLEDAHEIFYNAVAHGQRSNGGFGTDRCTGAAVSENPLFLEPVTYDVYWCCNMRGGECMARATESLFFTEEDHIYLPFYNSCTARFRFPEGEFVLEEVSDYPYEGRIQFQVRESTVASEKLLHFFLPSWAKFEKLDKNGKEEKIVLEKGFAIYKTKLKKGDIIQFRFKQKIKIRKTYFKNSVKGYWKYSYGPMLLGCRAEKDKEVVLSENEEFEQIGKGTFKLKGKDEIFSVLCDVRDAAVPDSSHQMLFRRE